ncbi:hypothetical protein Pint_07204 [Pistacia integerrima]|uniref:Uncharacterized protein n=1 Tax=Pistacia integerrima TaxID=434235 RepID=A0ACC0XRV4_9ROSI|nr:hypothetical protein Pint_07204 [Pistacia integerrima]
MFCTSYFNSSSTSIRTFLLKVFHFNDYQMSFVADSPVNSSSSDNFAAFLDAELGWDEEPEDEEARDEEAEDEEAGDDNDLNNKRYLVAGNVIEGSEDGFGVKSSQHDKKVQGGSVGKHTQTGVNFLCISRTATRSNCKRGHMYTSKILWRKVAEKPSIALSIATVLSRGKMFTRKDSTEFHEFNAVFLGSQAHYKVT